MPTWTAKEMYLFVNAWQEAAPDEYVTCYSVERDLTYSPDMLLVPETAYSGRFVRPNGLFHPERLCRAVREPAPF